MPGRRGKRSGVARELADRRAPRGIPAASTAPAERGGRERRARRPACSRDHSTSRPPGRHERQAQLDRDRRRRQRPRHHAGAGVAQRAAAERPRSAPRARARAAPSRGSRLRDERGLARRRLDQVRLARRGARSPSTRPGRPPPLPTSASGPGGAASTAGRPASASSTWRAAASAGIADRRDADRRRANPLHEQREAVEFARRAAPAPPSAMTPRATLRAPFHVKRAAACVT